MIIIRRIEAKHDALKHKTLNSVNEYELSAGYVYKIMIFF